MNDLLSALEAWLIGATIYGSAAILLIAVLSPIVRRALGAQASHILWILALAYLLVPWSSPWRVSTLLPPISSPEAVTGSFTQARIFVTISEGPQRSVTAIPVGQELTSPAPWLMAIWAGGALLALLALDTRVFFSMRLARHASEVTDHPLIQAALDKLDIRSHPRICETDRVSSPALCGLWRQVVLLPRHWDEQMDATKLACILGHEIGHFRRGDLWWRWVFQIARALHWFNPLVWVAERWARADQEMACDEWVLAHQDKLEIAQYGEALLAISRGMGRSRSIFSFQAGMAETRASLARRIRQITRFRPRAWWGLVVVLGIALLMWLCFGPIRHKKKPDTAVLPTPPPSVLPAPDVSAQRMRNVQIEVKIVALPPAVAASLFGQKRPSILSEGDFQNFLRHLQGVRDVDLLSAPNVTTRSGQRAAIQIVREFRYPSGYKQGRGVSVIAPTNFDSKPVGLSIEVEPYVTGNGEILSNLSLRIVDFVGFLKYGEGYSPRENVSSDPLLDLLQTPTRGANIINQPIFDTREMNLATVLKPGQTVVVGDMGAREGRVSNFHESLVDQMNEAMAGRLAGEYKRVTQRPNSQYSVYAFVTARLLDMGQRPHYTSAQQAPLPTPTPSAVPAPSPSDAADKAFSDEAMLRQILATKRIAGP